ncbi:EAL domain-containing protein [Jatrophihabitans telluris]|uniref:EAL domain-containing protein n=1 Tax=Jatrophihabitans telluris TaxID=2038343 RepID=A0ABY4QU92_9ACTN|nr:diguanylate cyclase [Jatrophihabitans telluris]UQX86863.1 EAL domain-containing protein [Jatrophihabitans telluris]
MTGIDEVLRERLVRTVFQPIVDLDSGAVVAYEALSRGPAGPLERPDILFAAARAAGCLTELDELCRRTALESAISAGIFDPLTVFINVEPEVLDSAKLGELVDLAECAPGQLQVVLEITERAIATRPAELLATVNRLRAAGWRIALDDVGAEDMSLAFMPLLRPDIVKLDLSLVQKRPGPAVAEIMNAVNAYAERTGAVLLAEGIEDEAHLRMATALGARLGQGWMFGRPAEGAARSLPTAALDLPPSRETVLSQSPFACLPADVPLRRSKKPLLIELSKFLEREAIRFGSTCVVVAAFQEAKHFTAATAARYLDLADQVGFVAAIGQDLGPEPIPGVRGADLDADDPVRGEWNIVVLAPHFAAALLARDLGDTGPDNERTFEFALTYERSIVADAAQVLLSRVLPVGPDRVATFPAAAQLNTASRPFAAAGRPGVHPDAERLVLETSVDATLRRALAATTNGVTIADVTRPNHPLVYVNSAFERLSGLAADEVLGINCRILQGEDTDPDAIRRIREAILDGREIRETLINYRGPERVRWWNEVYLAPVFDGSGRLVQYIGIQNDVTSKVESENLLQIERKRTARYLAELESLAFKDPLTGVWNRRRAEELVESAVLQSSVDGTGFALLYLDIDEFKQINDGHGHLAGDAVLHATAQRLQLRLRRSDVIARLGGDEFLVLLPGLGARSAAAEAGRIVDSLADTLSSPVALPRGAVTPSVSIGLATYPDNGADFDSLVHAADQQMYAGKQGRTR